MIIKTFLKFLMKSFPLNLRFKEIERKKEEMKNELETSKRQMKTEFEEMIDKLRDENRALLQEKESLQAK